MSRRKELEEDRRLRNFELQPDLKATLDRVGTRNYARATAAQFAPGGKYSEQANRRPRYAKL